MVRHKPSLRRQFLVWLLVPQLVFWLAGATLTFSVALYYANNLIDQNLQQSARALFSLIDWHAEMPEVNLESRVELLLKETDSEATFHYAAYLTPGGTLFANKKFPLPNYGAGPQRIFYTTEIDGRHARAIALVEPLDTHDGRKWLIVQLARTDNAQWRLYRDMFLAMILPLFILAVGASVLTRWGVGRGLAPFQYLQRLIESRKEQDLSPIDIGKSPQELVSLFDALNHLLNSARETIERQRRFIGDAAHQLRTPLAGLKSQTELAMRESTSQAQRERLQLVHTSATRSIHLVNQLLTLARSEPGNQASILRVHMDLAKLIREMTAELVPRALSAGIDLGCECSLSEAWIEGNSVLLRELFVNLVENSIKYIPRGGCVTVKLHEENGKYVVEIEDDGPGIPDDDKLRVFERFYRRQQDSNGCGLGMAIVKEIAERHGGSVMLRDAEPHGLIVRVVLPH